MSYRLCPWLVLCLVLPACASEHDRFYTLSTVPENSRTALATPMKNVILNVTIPSLDDRAEMVITTSGNGILVLDHERWADALSEQVTQTLARDLEARRNDLLVSERSFDQADTTPLKIKVEIVRMTARRDGPISIEARWHLVDTANSVDQIGSDRFDVPGGVGYAAVAQGYSEAAGKLADALISSLAGR